MAEEKETVVDKPTNARKLDYDMSAAPFLNVGKIEFEKIYKGFEKELKELEDNLDWMDFFKMEKEIAKKLVDGSLMVVETKQYRCIFNNNPGYEARKFKADSSKDFPSKFYTWQEVINTLKLWKDCKFKYDVKVEPSVHCINRNFRHVHIFKHKRGFLFANQFDMTYPEHIMKACILLNK